jgi:hypothetical protein
MPEIDFGGPTVVDLPVSPLAQLALGTGHRQARNSHCLASRRLSPVLDLEGAARPTRTTRPFARGPRSNPQDVPGASQLGCSAEPRAIQPPAMGSVVTMPQVDGLHHRYERRAA